MHKTGQSQGFPSRRLSSLKTGLSLIENVLKASDAIIQKEIFGSGKTTLIILNEVKNDIMKIIKSLEEYDLLIKRVSQTVKNESKEQKGGFLGL